MDVKDCLRIEDMDKSFDCVLKEVKNDTSTCKPRLVLLVDDEGCEPCVEALKHFAKEIGDSAITVIDTKSADGKDIVNKNKVEGEPSLLLLDCQNNMIV